LNIERKNVDMAMPKCPELDQSVGVAEDVPSPANPEAQRNLELNAMTLPAPGKNSILSRARSNPTRRPVRSSPLLWSEDELAAFIACIGVTRQACEKVQSLKLKGLAQLLDMSSSEMCKQLGLGTPIERLFAW
jgi:hypothetical protein